MDVPRPDVPPRPTRFRPGDRRTSLALGAIGLVVAGLLAGVLATLWLRPAALPVVFDRPQPAPRLLNASDSAALATPLDLATMNARFRQVSARARAAVVFVQVDPRDPARRFLERFGTGDPNGPPMRQQSIGSGVIMAPEGYIVTNNHVVADAGSILVTLPDRRQFAAEVVGADPSTDLAVLKIADAPDLPILPFGNSDDVQVGEWVLAVGNPYRLTSTVTAGIVSALGRQVNIIDDAYSIEDFIQTDAAINPGNSGGALVNLQGEVIGVNTAIATESGSNEGYGFAVPSNLVVRIATDLIRQGRVDRGELGVGIRDVSARLADQLGLDRAEGVYLQNVAPGGAAYRAGLRPGDVVTSVGGRKVDATNELQSAVARYRPGERVVVGVLRAGQALRFTVPLTALRPGGRGSLLGRLGEGDEVPEDGPPPDSGEPLVAPDRWGVGLRDVTRSEAAAFAVDGGAYVARVSPGSPAAFAGLPRDVVVTAVENEGIGRAEDLATALDTARAGIPLLLRVKRRDGTTAYYEIGPLGE